MNFTGERLHAEERFGHGAIEHLHRYAFVQQFVKPGYHVLDIASGEGYGTNMLAQTAGKAFGVDISAEAVAFAASKYRRENLQYLEGSATNIPLPDASLDVVVSFETLEHHPYHTEMMIEVKRVLKPAGVFIISTPERDNYHPTDPDNHYHVKELTGPEFEALITGHFPHMRMFRQKYLPASLLYSDSPGHDDIQVMTGNFSQVHAASLAGKHLFNVAVASGAPLNLSNSLHMFDGSEIMKLHNQYFIDMIDEIQNSKTYQLGDRLAKPLRALKNIFK